MKPSDVAEVLSDLLYAYPNTKMPDDDIGRQGVVRVWHGVLGDLENDHVRRAVSNWLNTEQWFPAPAQIRQEAIRIQNRLPSPHVAWNDVMDAVSSRSAEVWEQKHPVAIRALRDVGGPHAVTTASNITFVRDAFIKAYNARVHEVFIDPSAGTTSPAIGAQRATQALAEGQEE